MALGRAALAGTPARHRPRAMLALGAWRMPAQRAPLVLISSSSSSSSSNAPPADGDGKQIDFANAATYDDPIVKDLLSKPTPVLLAMPHAGSDRRSTCVRAIL
jgi:hypothetical protein